MCPLSSTEPWETFRLPWRSTAEARPGAGGPRRLRRGRAAAAPSPGGRRAPPGPRAPRHARRGEQLGVRSGAAGEVQRGAVAGGWCCILCWEKLGKIAGKQSLHFQIISKFCHLYYRSAIMHEHVNFTQIISNHLKSSQITSCMDVPKHGHVKV